MAEIIELSKVVAQRRPAAASLQSEMAQINHMLAEVKDKLQNASAQLMDLARLLEKDK